MADDRTVVHGCSGALAGVTSTVATNPLDTVKTCAQTTPHVTRCDCTPHAARSTGVWARATDGPGSPLSLAPLARASLARTGWRRRLQCSDGPVSVRDALRGVLREHGWRGLYAGLIPRLAAAVPRSVCTVVFYEQAVALSCRKPSAEAEGGGRW